MNSLPLVYFINCLWNVSDLWLGACGCFPCRAAFNLVFNMSSVNMDLHSIFNDCGDLSDPCCMAKVISYMEECQEEDEMFFEELKLKLENCSIYWPQPWYQQSTFLTRKLKTTANGDANADKIAEDENTEKGGANPHRKDKITKDESNLIDKNWKKLVAKYGIPDKPICFVRYKQREKSCKNCKSPCQRAKHFVTSFLAQGLQRTLPQVYNHFAVKHGCTSQGPYSEIEEKIMEAAFRIMPSKATALLTVVLGRHERGINKRYRIANGYEPVKSKIKWTLPLATKMLNYLMNLTNRPLKKLRNYDIEKTVWEEVGKKMDLPYYSLRLYWLRSLHVQLFVKEEVKLSSIRRRIFKMLIDSEYKTWSDVRWNEIVKEFPKGYTSLFLYTIISKVMITIPNYRKRPLKEVATVAKKLLKHKKRNYKLKHLKLNKDNILEVANITEEKMEE